MSRLLVVVCIAVIGLASAALLIYAKARLNRPLEELGSGPDSKPDYMKWAVGFEADFTSEDTNDPSKNCLGRMYVNALQEPRGMRREAICGGRKRTYIWRQDGVEAVLDTDKKVYWKPHTERRLMPLQDKESSRGHIGRETLNGRVVDHYTESRTQKDGSTVLTQVWEDLRLHSPVRIISPTYKYELTNVKEGAQPEVLFTIPSGFREVPPLDNR